MSKKPWTLEEEEMLRELYPKMSNREVAKRFGRSVSAIMHKAVQMDLKKNGGGSRGRGKDALSTCTPLPFHRIPQEEARKRDIIDILAVLWSVIEHLQKELEAQELERSERLKIIGILTNAAAVLNNVMARAEKEAEGDLDLRKELERFQRESGVNLRKIKKFLRRMKVEEPVLT